MTTSQAFFKHHQSKDIHINNRSMFTCTDTRDAENAFEGVGSGGCNEKLTANLHNEDCLFCQSQIYSVSIPNLSLRVGI